MSHRGSEDSDILSKKLLWLYVPDYTKNGALTTIESVGWKGSARGEGIGALEAV